MELADIVFQALLGAINCLLTKKHHIKNYKRHLFLTFKWNLLCIIYYIRGWVGRKLNDILEKQDFKQILRIQCVGAI